jgi:hypothetical protein
LYGALRTDIQTYVEDEIGDDLLAHTSELEKVRSLAVQYEIRERNREKDTARLLRSLGIPVKRIPKAEATAKQTAGNQLSDSEERRIPAPMKLRPAPPTTEPTLAASTLPMLTTNRASSQALTARRAPNGTVSLDLDALFAAIAAERRRWSRQRYDRRHCKDEEDLQAGCGEERLPPRLKCFSTPRGDHSSGRRHSCSSSSSCTPYYSRQ